MSNFDFKIGYMCYFQTCGKRAAIKITNLVQISCRYNPLASCTKVPSIPPSIREGQNSIAIMEGSRLTHDPCRPRSQPPSQFAEQAHPRHLGQNHISHDQSDYSHLVEDHQ